LFFIIVLTDQFYDKSMHLIKFFFFFFFFFFFLLLLFYIPSVVKIPRVKNKVKNSVWS